MAKNTRQNISYVNYAAMYYSDIAGIVEPGHYQGKFVQIRKSSVEYLVFSPRKFTRFHADIVERFCGEHNLPGVYKRENKIFKILAPRWKVVGGGKFEVDREKKLLRIYDNSMAYGKFEGKNLKENILSLPQFSGYKVQIE